jgi:Cys-tRNA(Pro)/Cys-tRNA(Cys) deacylase
MTPAIRAAEGAGVAFEVLEYAHDPGAESYGREAAAALGVAPEVVFKTLIVQTDAGRLAVGIVPVAASLDLKAIAAALGAKRVAMADPAAAERATGYVLGGISPLGQRKRLPTVVDASASAHDRVYVSAGRRGLEIALAPADLVRLCGARLAPVAR